MISYIADMKTLFITLLLCAPVLCSAEQGQPLIPATPVDYQANFQGNKIECARFEYQGHYYIVMEVVGKGMSFMHSPDCPLCEKRARSN